MERVRCDESRGYLRVQMRPARRGGLLAAALVELTLLALFCAGMIAVLRLEPEAAVVAAQPGLILLMFAGPALSAVAWLGGGSEVVECRDRLVVTLRAFGVPLFVRAFDPALVRDVRASRTPYLMRRHPLAPLNDRGDVAFDYGSRTYRFGRDLGQRADEVAARVAAAVSLMPPHPRGTSRPKASRVRIAQLSDRIEVRLRWRVYLRGMFLLGAMFAGPVIAVALFLVLVSASDILRLVVLGSAAAFLGLFAFAYAVYLPVEEVVVLHRGALWLGTIAYGIRTKGTSYPLPHAGRIRCEVQDDLDYGQAMTGWLTPRQGLVAFDYGPETYRFGKYVSDAEAREVADALNGWLQEAGLISQAV